jgi:uncharacterized protein (TIGR02271 family)
MVLNITYRRLNHKRKRLRPNGFGTALAHPCAMDEPHQQRIPLAREELDISRREVESGRVRVATHVREREELIEQRLRHEHVEIERVPVNRVLDGPVQVREEGDVVVIPVVEEVLVVQKQLVLKEEVRIRRRSVDVPHRQRVALKAEEISVERAAENDTTQRERK